MGMRSTIFPNTLGDRVYPGRGMLWRRWEPGQGYEGHGYQGFAGMGDEPLLEPEPTYGWDPGAIDLSSGEMDPALYYADPGYNILTDPGPELTPTEFAAEQKRATDWLAMLPNLITTAEKVFLNSSQIASGVQAGVVKSSSTCPSGYLVSGTGQCVAAAASQWVDFATNQQILTWGAIALGGIVLINLIPSGGKRRRR